MNNAQNVSLLEGFKDKVVDLAFIGEDDNGQLFEVLMDLGEIAEYLGIEGKRIDMIDGSDDIMEAAYQMFDRWKTGVTEYSIEVKKQK